MIHAKTQRREEGVPAAKPPSIAHIRDEGSADPSSAPPPRLRVSARTITTLAAAATLAACIGPRPAAPAAGAVAPPPAWRTALGQGQPIQADWWSAFGDPDLTDLVARALANHVANLVSWGHVTMRTEGLDLEAWAARLEASP